MCHHSECLQNANIIIQIQSSYFKQTYYLSINQMLFQKFKFMKKQIFSTLMFVDPCIIAQFIQKNPTRCNSVSKFITPYLYEAQHVSGNTPPFIRSLKLHWQPLVCVRGRLLDVVVARRPQRPTTFHACKSEAASTVLGY